MKTIGLRETLKGMTKKDQIDYIWEYYKGWILGSLLLGVLLFLFIDGLLNKDAEPLGVTVLSDATVEEINGLTEDLDAFGVEAYLNHIYHEGGRLEDQGLQILERLSTSLAVGQIDIFVLDQALASEMLEEDMFKPLDEVITNAASIPEAERFTDAGNYYGIKASAFSLFDAYPNLKDLYLFVPQTARHPEEINQFFEKYIKESIS